MELKVYFVPLTVQNNFCKGLLQNSWLKEQILQKIKLK